MTAAAIDADTQAQPPKKSLMRFAPIAIIVAGLGAAYAAGLHNYLSLETLRDQREVLAGFVEAQPVLAVGAYLAVYVLATTFMLPGALWITIAGGFLFGLVGGSAATVVGATLGASVLFFVARTAIGESLRRRAGPFLKKMEAGFNENAFSYMFAMRFLPVVPFPVANIAPALLGAKARDFIITTFFGIMPGVVAYTWIGAGLGATFDAGGTPDIASFAKNLIPAFAALGVVSLLPAIVKRVRGQGAAS